MIGEIKKQITPSGVAPGFLSAWMKPVGPLSDVEQDKSSPGKTMEKVQQQRPSVAGNTDAAIQAQPAILF